MNSDDRWNAKDWVIVFGLFILTTLVFSLVLFSRNWSLGVELDFLRQFYPARVFAANSISAGSFPVWNPHTLCGYPYFASYQTAMLYPFNLIMVGVYGVLGLDFSLKALCAFAAFHFFLAGVFTYILAREFKLRRVASVVAAVAYMLCGFMTAHAGHINQLSASAWLPLIFFLFYRSLTRRKISYSVGAGAAMGIALLAGHFQSIFYLCVFMSGFAVYMTGKRYREGDGGVGPLSTFLSLGVAIIIAVGIAAAQLLPTLELIGLSTRNDIPYSMAVVGSIPRWQIVNLVFPKFFGSGPENYVGGWMMWETYGYAGVTCGVLGVIALLRKKKGLVIFLWISLIVSLILALGPGGYLFTVLYKAGLFFNRLHDPARTLVIFGFSSALLAGFGADYLLDAVEEPSMRHLHYKAAVRLACIVVALVVALAVVLSVFLLIRGADDSARDWIGIKSMVFPLVLLFLLLTLLFSSSRIQSPGLLLGTGLVLIVIVDLVALNVPWTMIRVDADNIFGDKSAMEYIASQDGEFRVETDANTLYKTLDDGPVYGVDKTTGDDSLVLEDYDRYRNLILPSVAPGVQPGLFYEGGLRSPLLDLMNAEYFVSQNKINPKLARGKFEYIVKKGDVHIYRNKTVMPRAWMSESLAFNNNEEVFEKLSARDGEELKEKALVVYPATGTREGKAVTVVEGDVEIKTIEPNHLVIETDRACKGLLVVSEVDYPGWDVYVDGKKKEILKTNFLFRGVMLEGGQKRVEFKFRSSPIKTGLIISMVTSSLLVIYFGALYIKRKRERPVGEVHLEALGYNARS
ncbi:MAG: YfhO family protein [Actinobacteria bacterium]|nr:YfhO family protein [Actinomycetota bacterium]